MMGMSRLFSRNLRFSRSTLSAIVSSSGSLQSGRLVDNILDIKPFEAGYYLSLSSFVLKQALLYGNNYEARCFCTKSALGFFLNTFVNIFFF